MVNGLPFSHASVKSLHSQPGRPGRSSLDVGWTSLFVQEWTCPCDGDAFEAPETDDQTLVVFLKGAGQLECWRAGAWRSAWRPQGSAGLTAPHELDRLRWRRAQSTAVHAAYIYLPEAFLIEAGGVASARTGYSSLHLDDPALHGVAHALLAGVEVGAPDLHAEAAAMFLATHLTANHSRAACPIGSSPNGVSARARCRRAVEMMRARLHEPLLVADLAQAAGLSAFRFAHMFKQEMGEGPARHLTRLRLEFARELLWSTDRPVGEIGLACGYASASAFSAAVRRHFGASAAVLRDRRNRRA